MSEKETERLLKALANRRRLAILSFLNKVGERNVGEIATHIKLSFRSTSRHLALLAAAELVDKEQRSVQIFYSLNKNPSTLTKSLLKTLF